MSKCPLIEYTASSIAKRSGVLRCLLERRYSVNICLTLSFTLSTFIIRYGVTRTKLLLFDETEKKDLEI